MTGLSAKTRAQTIQEMATTHFDLVIVGGGINGAGVARDAASRGLKVAVVEANDFSYGTSSRSSKLIHGGIRYLENLEFGLVFEALSERRILFEIAPHLVHPLKFVLPVYKTSKHGMFEMGLGMWLYDLLSLYDAPESHERLDQSETQLRLPLLQTDGLKGAYAYYDAYMDDDRLTLETLRSAEAMGALCANYFKVVGRTSEGSKTTGLVCQDQETGQNHTVRGTHFIGSVGPWTDIFGEQILHGWKRTLRPTKGVHITLDRSRLPLKEAIVMVDDAKGRIVFGIPRHEMIIIGTTDTDYPADPSDVRTLQQDVDYLLKVASEYFPGAELKESDILSSYSGVRPLVFDGAESEGKTSREHKIWADPRNFTFVAGGKYTTYRHMAEEIVDFALDFLPDERRGQLAPSQTKVALNPLASGSAFEKARSLIGQRQWPIADEDVRWLCERHGMEFLQILSQGLAKGYSSVWEFEALHAIHTTMCLHLDDFYIRRVPLFLSRKNHGLEFQDSIMAVFARELGWDRERQQNEVERLSAHLLKEMGWRHQS